MAKQSEIGIARSADGVVDVTSEQAMALMQEWSRHKGKFLWQNSNGASVWDYTLTREQIDSMRSQSVVFKQLRGVFHKAGFALQKDPDVAKRYKTLADWHYLGTKGSLVVGLECSGMSTQIQFWQPDRAKHPVSGKYDFDSVARMDYLNRVEVRRMWAKVLAFYQGQGFTWVDYPIRNSPDGLDWLREKRARDFAGRWARTGNHLYVNEMCNGNCTDGDGSRVSEGETRWAYGYDGRLIRGTAYYSLNNMWFLADARGKCLGAFSSWELFGWREGLVRRRKDGKRRLRSELAKAVEVENFERAIILRDLLRKVAA